MSIFNVLVERLASEPYLGDYKLRKRDSRLIKKISDGESISVFFNHYSSAMEKKNPDDETQKYAFTVMALPIYEKRFDILHKWFEKYSCRQIADQRQYGSIGFSDDMLFGWTFFQFEIYGANFESEYERIFEHIKRGTMYIENNFGTLSQLYDYIIKPVLDGGKYDHNDDQIFWHLALARLVSPEGYKRFKQIALDQIEYLKNKDFGSFIGDPNMTPYIPKLDAIFHELETTGPTL